MTEADPASDLSDLATPRPVDVLAVVAHRDDAELLCGGTLLRAADRGYRTGVLDLTRGEMGSRGTAATRAREAARAARVLGLTVRANAGLPDAGVFNTATARERVVELLRRCRPRVVILPWRRGRHPDHPMAAELGRDACYLAGLRRYPARPPEESPASAARGARAGAAAAGGGSPGRPGPQEAEETAKGEVEDGPREEEEVREEGAGDEEALLEPHRPVKILYALAFREDPVKPTFVVDISEQFDRKLEAVRCYASQFDEVTRAGEVFPTGEPLYDRVETAARHYGSLIRRPYGEPFYTDETMRVDDVMALDVPSM